MSKILIFGMTCYISIQVFSDASGMRILVNIYLFLLYVKKCFKINNQLIKIVAYAWGIGAHYTECKKAIFILLIYNQLDLLLRNILMKL